MIKNITKLMNTMIEGIKDQTDIAIVGLSGGVDSTVVATLCREALGARNVIGIHMPFNNVDTETKGKFNTNSVDVSQKLEIKDFYINIMGMTSSLNKAIYEVIDKPLNKLNEGNSRARMRMSILYSMAHEIAFSTGKKVRVVGTGNLSEDYIGYDTKGGDALADFFPIGQLFKSEVYQLADYFVAREWLDKSMIDRDPSAGLWEGQTDESEIGYTYNEMEVSIRKLRPELWCGSSIIWRDSGIEDMEGYSEIDKFVHKRHIQNVHKHEAPFVFEIRGTEMVD